MGAVGKYSNDTLQQIKKNVSKSYEYFHKNFESYHKFRKLVFDTSVTDEQQATLKNLGKPIIEFNILEAYISRLLGEFVKHEPSIEVTPADGMPIDQATIGLIEGHIRHIIYEANKNSCSYDVYKDLLSGGFSVIKIWVDYANSMSFNKVIRLDRVYDPTLCGFDPMARYSHKGDGQYCFELYPKTREDFEREYPGVNINDVSFSRNVDGFNWSYVNDQNEDILLIGEYFQKKKKRAKIVKLANGRTMLEKNYDKFIQDWNDQGILAVPPAVIGKSRWTDIQTIEQSIVIDSEIIHNESTDYNGLPRIFVDGNSIMLRQGTSNNIYQKTRPYVYQAEGIQSLKNFAGQTLANELERMVQHQFIIKKEAIPQEEDYLDALDDLQHANTIVVNAYSENSPDKPIPDPIREVMRQNIPQEVAHTFSVTDNMTQMIMGTFDAALGINDNQLSGVAIIEAATQSNAVAMPYLWGYLQAYTQFANMCVDLLPKYIKTPRTIPIIGLDGKRKFEKVNQGGKPSFNYDENALQVKVETGVNFQIQKNKALQQLIAMMQASQSFSEFMNGPGLPVLVKNLTIYGADELKAMVPVWQQQKEKQQQVMMQQQQQMMMNNPQMLRAKTEMAKVQQQGQQNQVDNQLKIAELAIDKQRADNDSIKMAHEASINEADLAVQREKAQAEVYAHGVDAASKIASVNQRAKEHEHASIHKSVSLHHELNQAEKDMNNASEKIEE